MGAYQEVHLEARRGMVEQQEVEEHLEAHQEAHRDVGQETLRP